MKSELFGNDWLATILRLYYRGVMTKTLLDSDSLQQDHVIICVIACMYDYMSDSECYIVCLENQLHISNSIQLGMIRQFTL